MEVPAVREVNPGDTLIVWWPNGAGYDEFLVCQVPATEDHVQIVFVASHERTSDGGWAKKT